MQQILIGGLWKEKPPLSAGCYNRVLHSAGAGGKGYAKERKIWGWGGIQHNHQVKKAAGEDKHGHDSTQFTVSKSDLDRGKVERERK